MSIEPSNQTELVLSQMITYRAELLGAIFQHVQKGDSCTVVGASGMGKSRLIQLVMQEGIRQEHLDESSSRILLIQVDCNRANEISKWGLCELLLMALVETIGQHEIKHYLRSEIQPLHHETVMNENELLAQRNLELAAHILCQEHGLQLCFILDEFDEAYQALSPQALANLRGLRDAHKYQLSYLLFLRNRPDHIRPPDECEGFYEKVTREVLGLQPYNREDTQRIMAWIVERRYDQSQALNPDVVEALTDLCGGHPGLLEPLIDALIKQPPLGKSWEEWADELPDIHEECSKLWQGLPVEERKTLNHLAQGLSTGYRERESLLLKGLIREVEPQHYEFFTPLFRKYAAHQAPTMDNSLYLDPQAGTVTINGQLTSDLTAKEYSLLEYLYQHLDEICEVGQIISHLYPGEEGYNITDNNITALIGRVRKKIEPNPQKPQFLLNARGRGYKLVCGASDNTRE